MEERAAAVTERSEEATGARTQSATQEVPAEKKIVYSIVNQFLGQMTFNNLDAEEMLLTAVEDESFLMPPMEQRIEEVFSRIF